MSGYEMRKWQAQQARSDRIEREKLAAGHDFDAEARARRIRSAESARESFADLEGFDAKIDAKIAEIRAEGPTTCSCGHEFCEADKEGAR